MAESNLTTRLEHSRVVELAKNAWHMLNARAGAKYNFSKCYINVEVRMTREEFLEWAIPEYELWLAEHPNQTPSIDRADPNGHYEIGNLQILEVQENRRKARHFINDHAPEGTKHCGHCEEFLPLSKFNKSCSSKDGLSNHCRICASKLARESFIRRHPEKVGSRGNYMLDDNAPEGMRWCKQCRQFLPITSFRKEKRTKKNPLPLARRCRVCQNKRASERRRGK